MKNIPPYKSVHIILVLNHQQKVYSFEELRKRMKDQGYGFRENRNQFILAEGLDEDDIDEYRFLTPDEPLKLKGIRVADFEEKGNVYEHPKIHEMREAIEYSLI